MRHVIVLCALAACGHSDGKRDSGTIGGEGSVQPSDSGNGDGTGSSTSMNGADISCYSQGDPSALCTLPVHCCFSNFSAQHDGACDSAACTWGTIECDGPEDCTNGGHCCSTQLTDQDGIYGYRVACQAGACGAQPAHEEVCHPSGPACANGGSCVTAFGNNSDLPRSLAICR